MKKSVLLQAKPKPLEIDLQRTAVIVVDMQNAVCRKGGMLDKLTGMLDEVMVSEGILANKKVIEAARGAGIKLVYLRMAHRPDFSDAGGSESPSYWKDFSLIAMREQPELRGKFVTQGSWDAEIIDELKPEPGDIVVDKGRYSGFRHTDLEAVLQTYNIKYLVFLGNSTNICVESTLRDAFFLEYFPILVSDGCWNAGPPFTQDATIFAVEMFFGWVTTSNDFVNALR